MDDNLLRIYLDSNIYNNLEYIGLQDDFETYKLLLAYQFNYLNEVFYDDKQLLLIYYLTLQLSGTDTTQINIAELLKHPVDDTVITDFLTRYYKQKPSEMSITINTYRESGKKSGPNLTIKKRGSLYSKLRRYRPGMMVTGGGKLANKKTQKKRRQKKHKRERKTIKHRKEAKPIKHKRERKTIKRQKKIDKKYIKNIKTK